MDNRFDLLVTGGGTNGLDRSGVVIGGRLVTGPQVFIKIDAGAPVLQPDIVAVVDEVLYQRGFDGSPEDIGPDTGTVDKQHRPF